MSFSFVLGYVAPVLLFSLTGVHAWRRLHEGAPLPLTGLQLAISLPALLALGTLVWQAAAALAGMPTPSPQFVDWMQRPLYACVPMAGFFLLGLSCAHSTYAMLRVCARSTLKQ